MRLAEIDSMGRTMQGSGPAVYIPGARAGEQCLVGVASAPSQVLSLTGVRHGGTSLKTRLLKVACLGCGCSVRMTRVWIQRGRPVCGCCDGGQMAVAA
jgi:hypothetical protein